jgi:hypothetical protein
MAPTVSAVLRVVIMLTATALRWWRCGVTDTLGILRREAQQRGKECPRVNLAGSHLIIVGTITHLANGRRPASCPHASNSRDSNCVALAAPGCAIPGQRKLIALPC